MKLAASWEPVEDLAAAWLERRGPEPALWWIDAGVARRIEARLVEIQRDGDGPCWEWQGARDSSGYGQISVRGVRELTHRLVYAYFHGGVPKGLELDHVCRNRCCARPDHLEPVTGVVNTLRGESGPARNARKTCCVHGHPFDDANTRISRGRRHCITCQNERNARRSG
jgi:hypothetical protein